MTTSHITLPLIVKRADLEECDLEQAQITVNSILDQIAPGALWSLGAMPTHALIDEEARTALVFSTIILPFVNGGKRSVNPISMTLTITLEWSDTYTLEVYYEREGEKVVHFQQDHLYFDDLTRMFLALDFNGPEVLNPRYA